MQFLSSLIEHVRVACVDLPDERRGDVRYSMADIGLSAFSLFFMQSESFLSYQRGLEEGRKTSNCRTLFGMAAIPTDNHIRAMLDPVHPSHLQPAFDGMLEAMRRRDGFAPFRRLGGRVPIALVPRRPDAPADPMDDRPRPRRRTQAPGLPGHRSRRHGRGHAGLVRPPMGGRGHPRLRGGRLFEEARPHLGVETQRQWSDLVVLWMNDLVQSRHIVPQATAWYRETRLTFADAIAAVRREIWHHQAFATSRSHRDVIEIPAHIWCRMEAALAHAR